MREQGAKVGQFGGTRCNLSVVVHDFKERLAWSEQASDEPFWEAVYRKAFPDMIALAPCPGDTQSQRMGIDRIVHLASGKTLKIDEKKRSKEYDDVLLEYVANDVTLAPGWIEKDLLIDYLAYAFMPTRRCLLLPWELLRRCWRVQRKAWLEKYQIIEAPNRSYKTLSVAVPTKVLKESIGQATLVQV